MAEPKPVTLPEPVHPSIALHAARKWAITGSVMRVTIMQILDTSITNVALPHMQGTLSTSVEETSWVITSYLAANAIVIPATGWLTGMLGRRRLFLVCTSLFTISSFLSGLAPKLGFLVAMRACCRAWAAGRWSPWRRPGCGRSFRCASVVSPWPCGAWA